MAPGPGGDLFVSIPAPGGTVVARIDRTGQPQPGWPIRLPGTLDCGMLLPVDDGSIRVVCNEDDPTPELGPSHIVAFAIDAAGRSLASWPVDVPCCLAGRVIGDNLTVYGSQSRGDVVQEGQPFLDAWIVNVAPDGTIRHGNQVPFMDQCCFDSWAVGPDGVAYGIVLHPGETPAGTTSELMAVGPAGVPAGFPVAIDGIASEPVFDAAGRIHVVVGIPFEPPTRTLVFGPDGRRIDAGSDELDIAPVPEFIAIETSPTTMPAPPIVASDGTTFLVEFGIITTVLAVSTTGQVMEGWPYRSDGPYQRIGNCPSGVDGPCDSSFWTLPAVGPGNVLYLVHGPAKPSTGGSVVAIGQDGRVVTGWPVGLRRPGSGFWSIVVGPDGTVYGLAIEPEAGDTSSASILAFAPDSTVLYTTTIVEP